MSLTFIPQHMARRRRIYMTHMDNLLALVRRLDRRRLPLDDLLLRQLLFVRGALLVLSIQVKGRPVEEQVARRQHEHDAQHLEERDEEGWERTPFQEEGGGNGEESRDEGLVIRRGKA